MPGGIEFVLIDCPFCGSSNVGMPFDDRPSYWVTCYECGCDGPLVDRKHKEPEPEARLRWNRRKLLQLGEPIPA